LQGSSLIFGRTFVASLCGQFIPGLSINLLERIAESAPALKAAG
jgi:hypothetical protein